MPITSLPTSSFVKPPPDEFICSICFDVLCDPVHTRCNHDFCRKCIESALAASGNCPVCRQHLNENELDHVLLIRNLIAKLDIRCSSCEEVMRVEQLERHMERCGGSVMPCQVEGCMYQAKRVDKDVWAQHYRYGWEMHCKISQESEIALKLVLGMHSKLGPEGRQWFQHDLHTSVMFAIPNMREMRQKGQRFFTRVVSFSARPAEERFRFRLLCYPRGIEKFEDCFSVFYCPALSDTARGPLKLQVEASVWNFSRKTASLKLMDPCGSEADRKFFRDNAAPPAGSAAGWGWAGFLSKDELDRNWSDWVKDDVMLIKLSLLS